MHDMHEEAKELRTKMFGPILGPSSFFLLKAMNGRVHARADSSACSALLGVFCSWGSFTQSMPSRRSTLEG